MSSYYNRERDRDYDYDDRNVTIKRYVVPSDDRDDRRDFMSSRDDSYGDREVVIRRKTEREEPLSIHRYERDIEYDPPVRRYEREHYEPRYISPRQSEYEVDDEYYRRRVDDRPPRRELSPGDSISQASRRRGRDRDAEYSSDDEYYYHEETRNYDGDHPHHRRHMAEGALVGAGAAELIRSHRRREGDEVSHGVNHAIKTAGAGALGAVAVNAASHVREYYRSKSRSRRRSFDDDRSRNSHRHSRHGSGRWSHSRSRSRSKSHSRAKTLMEVGLGAAAIAAGVAALRNNKAADERQSRSRTRSRSRARGSSIGRSASGKGDDRSMSERRKHMAGAGLAGAAVAGLVEHHRSKSRSRKGERSHSRLRRALPVVAAGLGTAAATGLWEKNKADKEGKEPGSRGRSRSKSRTRGSSDKYPDPTRDSAGLIEYGKDPVTGSIPTEHYYGAPNGDHAYYSDGGEYNRRPSRSRSRSRGARYSGGSSGSDRESHRRHRKHRSRSKDLAGAALGATGLGYAAHKYSQSRERKKADREQDRTRYEDAHNDPYEESYDPAPYPPSPPTANYQQPPHDNYYPNNPNFPPPAASATNLNEAPPNAYNPADYPPPPGAAPPAQPYNYGAPGPGTEQYAPRARRTDENVSAPKSSIPPVNNLNVHNGLTESSSKATSKSIPPQLDPQKPPKPPSKSVSFNIQPKSPQRHDRGYETDYSESKIDGHGHNSHRTSRHRGSSSVPHPPMTHRRSSSNHEHESRSQHHSSKHAKPSKHQEPDSDATIDMPKRFDQDGHLLRDREDTEDTRIEDFIKLTSRLFA